MKIWLPELGRVYATTYDGKNVYVRFTAYGVSNATSGRPIDLTFGVYHDIDCKNMEKYEGLTFNERWEKQKQIYHCDFIDTGVVIERLNEKKFPETLEKLLHTLSLKSNKHARMDVTIIFKDTVEISANVRYPYRCTINKLDDGCYTYGHFATRYPETYVKSFTADDVIEIHGKVLGKYFRYINGQISWK